MNPLIAARANRNAAVHATNNRNFQAATAMALVAIAQHSKP